MQGLVAHRTRTGRANISDLLHDISKTRGVTSTPLLPLTVRLGRCLPLNKHRHVCPSMRTCLGHLAVQLVAGAW